MTSKQPFSYSPPDTPRPWLAELYVDEVFQIFQGEELAPEEPEWWITDAEGNPFQPVQSYTDEAPDALEGRALLFAAVPELFDAVVSAIALLKAWDRGEVGEPLRVDQQLRDAFLKATGRDYEKTVELLAAKKASQP